MPRQTSFLLKTRVSPPADAEGQALNGGLEAERAQQRQRFIFMALLIHFPLPWLGFRSHYLSLGLAKWHWG